MRLTDDRTYLQVKANVDALRLNGFEVSISDLRYIKLAEFERYEEKRARSYESIVVENAALRLQLKEVTEMNNRLREAIQRQSADNFEYD